MNTMDIQYHKDRNEMLASLPKGMVIAELGVFMGDFSEDILRICEPSKLYLVDIWEGSWGSGRPGMPLGENYYVEDMFDVYIYLKDKYKDDPRVEVVRMDSVDFLKSLPDNHLDLVYLDSRHYYEPVLMELIHCDKKVNKYITGHDYITKEGFGVIDAINTFCDLTKLRLTRLTQEEHGYLSFMIEK